MEDLIIKYLANNATASEEKFLMEWINESEENLKTFSSMQLLCVSQSMPNKRAESEVDNFLFNAIISKGKKELKSKKIAIACIAASLAVLLSANIVLLLFDKMWSKENLLTYQDNVFNGYYHEVYTEKGVKAYVVLPDSSKVWLNSDSRISFPDKFTGPCREVKISSGEYYFDVVRNIDTPMIVHTSMDFKIEVVGTAFNVRTYKEDKESQTTLISGSINLIKDIQNGRQDEVTKLYPNDSYVVRKDKTSIIIRNSQVTSKEIAWKEGFLIFESTLMEDIITKLERWYGAKFYIKDPEVLEQRITATFQSESLIQIMEMIKFCSPIDYSLDHNTITLMKKKKNNF